MQQYLLLSAGIMVLLPLAAQAQQASSALMIGASITNLSGTSASDFEPRASLAGGVALGYDFGNGLALQPELLYLVKGAYADAEIDDMPIRARFDITYLEVPLLVVYRFRQRSRLQPKVFAGPSVAFKLDARVHFRPRDSDGRMQTEKDETVEAVDYGAVAGAGTEFEVGSQRLSFEARALLGRANVRMADPALHNVGVVFFVGVVF